MNARPRAARSTSTRAKIVFAALPALAACAFYAPPLHADDGDYPYASREHCSIRGTIRRVDAATDHLTLVGDDDRVYIVDAYGARVILSDITRRAETQDLERGMHVRASGVLVGENLVEATAVRQVSDVPPPGADVSDAALGDSAIGRTTLDGVVRLVDPDHARVTVADGDGGRIVVDTLDALITLGNGNRDGQTFDLSRGMHVLISGTRLPRGRMVAERVRVLADEPAPAPLPDPAPAPAPRVVEDALPALPPAPAVRRFGSLIPPSPDPQFVLAHLDDYTGILIDARHLAAISRSPAPNIFGPEPGESLLYPDRAHVPTPDEVQDESIVRYYHTEAEAQAGVAGTRPLILPAQAVLTPAKDSLQLSADDMVLFNALEQKLHYSRTWKVGFLIPGNQ